MRRKSYRVIKVGSLNNLKLVEEEIPQLSDDQVTVEVKAIGLNFADVFTILGLYKASPKEDFIPGLEFSGVITDKGRNVSGFSNGERVIGVIRFGAYTTHINIDHRYIIKLPDEWSFEEGASFIVQALTAYYALVPLGNIDKLHEIAGIPNVLIHSAAGGVGIYANRIAKRFSAYTIGTIGSASKRDLLKSEGYDDIIVRDNNFRAELEERLNGKMLDLVMDAVGGKVQKDSFDFLAPTGRLVSYGLSQFMSHGTSPNYFKLALRYLTMPRYQSLTLIESNKSVLGFNLIWLYDRVNLMKTMLNEITLLQLGKPYIGKVFPYDKFMQAIREFQSGNTTGKVVVTIN
jgi:NADPH:quinone reductase-like Zn-dependent oxidoreductase